MNKSRIIITLCACLLGSIASEADALITPVSVTASSTLYSYDANRLIDNSGLSGGLHSTNHLDMWMNNAMGASGVLTFDLGSIYTLTDIYVWQYNHVLGATSFSERGVNEFVVSSSLDGTTFMEVAMATLSEASGTSDPAQVIGIDNIYAQYIRFEILSNFGDADYTGLSEVKFSDSPIPLPVSVWLFCSGLLGLIGVARHIRAPHC